MPASPSDARRKLEDEPDGGAHSAEATARPWLAVGRRFGRLAAATGGPLLPDLISSQIKQAKCRDDEPGDAEHATTVAAVQITIRSISSTVTLSAVRS